MAKHRRARRGGNMREETPPRVADATIESLLATIEQLADAPADLAAIPTEEKRNRLRNVVQGHIDREWDTKINARVRRINASRAHFVRRELQLAFDELDRLGQWAELWHDKAKLTNRLEPAHAALGAYRLARYLEESIAALDEKLEDVRVALRHVEEARQAAFVKPLQAALRPLNQEQLQRIAYHAGIDERRLLKAARAKQVRELLERGEGPRKAAQLALADALDVDESTLRRRLSRFGKDGRAFFEDMAVAMIELRDELEPAGLVFDIESRRGT